MNARTILIQCQKELISQAEEKGKGLMVLEQGIKPVKEKI
jgi:hypothetical protein